MRLEDWGLDEASVLWLNHSIDDRELTSKSFENSFVCSKRAEQGVSDARELSPLLSETVLYFVHQETYHAVYGWTFGLKLPVQIVPAAVVAERFVLVATGHDMPIMIHSLKFSNGEIAYGRIVRTSFGYRGSWTVNGSAISSYCQDVLIEISNHNDCAFCLVRQTPCQCMPELQAPSSTNYLMTYQWLSSQVSTSLWERYVLTIFVQQQGASAMTIHVSRLQPSLSDNALFDDIHLRYRWALSRGDEPRYTEQKRYLALSNRFQMPPELAPIRALTDPLPPPPVIGPSAAAPPPPLPPIKTAPPKKTARASTSSAQHGPKADVAIKCEICDAVFIRGRDLKRHVEGVHEDRRRFKCEQCQSAFTQLAHLQSHKKAVHEKIRALLCKLCSRPFCTKYQLQRWS